MKYCGNKKFLSNTFNSTILTQLCITLCLNIILCREGLCMVMLVSLRIAKGTSCSHIFSTYNFIVHPYIAIHTVE